MTHAHDMAISTARRGNQDAQLGNRDPLDVVPDMNDSAGGIQGAAWRQEPDRTGHHQPQGALKHPATG